jgi:hypothetical protein
VPSIEEVLAKIKVPVRSVPICLDADLQAEHDELTNQLDVLNRETNGKMNGRTEAREIADRLRELEQLMHDSEVTFKFRGLTRGRSGSCRRSSRRRTRTRTGGRGTSTPALRRCCPSRRSSRR